mgnify:CR=1 FL=1
MLLPNLSKCQWQTSSSWQDVAERHKNSTEFEKQSAFYRFVEEKGEYVENEVIQRMRFESNLRMLRSKLNIVPGAAVWKMVSENAWCQVWDALLEVFKRRPEGAPIVCMAKNIFGDLEAVTDS